MSNPTVVRAASPADFLALLPTLAGFTPRNSVCVVPFASVHGRSRALGVARFDLPKPEQIFEMRDVVASVLPRFSTADAVVFVVYTDSPQSKVTTSVLALLNELGIMAHNQGFDVRDSLVVEPESWYSFLDVADDQREYSVAMIAEAAERLGYAKPEPAADHVLEPRELTDGQKVETVRCIRQVNAEGVRPEVLDYAARGLVAMGEGDATPLDMAYIVNLLPIPMFRDQMLVTCATGTDIEDDAALARLVIGEMDEAPDKHRLEHGVRSYWALAQIVEEGEQAAHLYNVAGWCAWALGMGSLSGRLLNLALEEDPENVLAQYLNTLIGGGLMPKWSFRVGDSRIEAARAAAPTP